MIFLRVYIVLHSQEDFAEYRNDWMILDGDLDMGSEVRFGDQYEFQSEVLRSEDKFTGEKMNFGKIQKNEKFSNTNRKKS